MPAPLPHRATLPKHRGRRQAKVDADVNRPTMHQVKLLAMQAVTIFRIDRLTIAYKTILAIDVNLDPILVFACNLTLVILWRQMIDVLSVKIPATWLLEKGPAFWLYFLGQLVPPMIGVRWVSVSNDARPAATAHQHRRITADAAGQPVDHSLRHFPGFVHPGTGQLHRQQLCNVVRPVQRDKQHFQVQIAFDDVMRWRSGVNPTAKRRRHPLMPALDRRRAQLRVGVSDHGPPGFPLAVSVDLLFLGAAQDLHDAGR